MNKCVSLTLNAKVKFYKKSLKSQNFLHEDADVVLEEIGTFFGNLKPLQTGYTTFDGVGLNDTSTHVLYVRYTPIKITSENWVEYKENYYKIDSVINVEEKDEYYKMKLTKRGDITLEANLG